MKSIFENPQIDIDQLPRARDLKLIPLSKKYLTVRAIGSLIFAIITLMSLGIFFTFSFEWSNTNYVLFGLVGWLILVGINLFVVIRGFRIKSYALRDKDIMYRSGLIWRSETAIPFNRVQHVDIHRGPLDRIFELSKINIYTAGGQSSDLSIPGLEPDDAQALKDFIIKKTLADEEE